MRDDGLEKPTADERLHETPEASLGGVRYAIRLPANDVLEPQIEDLLTRPRGRPSRAARPLPHPRAVSDARMVASEFPRSLVFLPERVAAGQCP